MAYDESADATDIAQLLIFLRELMIIFCIKEELLDLRSLMGTTTGKDIFKAVSDAINQAGLTWHVWNCNKFGSGNNKRVQRE